MKKVILVLAVVFMLCTVTYTESAHPLLTDFSCLIEEEIIEDYKTYTFIDLGIGN